MLGYKTLMSSSSTDWSTPQEFYNNLNEEFHFTLDVCATNENAKCQTYFTKEQDGLVQPWSGVCWMNPPYGRAISKWVSHAYASSLEGVTVVCLLPARTDTRWFHTYCLKGELRWVKGRLRFGQHKNPATFPSFVCIFHGVK